MSPSVLGPSRSNSNCVGLRKAGTLKIMAAEAQRGRNSREASGFRNFFCSNVSMASSHVTHMSGGTCHGEVKTLLGGRIICVCATSQTGLAVLSRIHDVEIKAAAMRP